MHEKINCTNETYVKIISIRARVSTQTSKSKLKKKNKDTALDSVKHWQCKNLVGVS